MRRAWPAAIGVEMEGLGVALAAYRAGGGFLLVKGISDFADGGKDDRWRGYAAETAARFALAALRRRAGTSSRGRPPRQLPRDVTWFTGRSPELQRLLAMAADPLPNPAVTISTIDGMAGIGKTALAVHAAHQLAGRYPDGQLFLDLHGFTTGVARVEPADALDRLLRDTGVPAERIPAGLDERAALWRSRMAGRRMLIVLDNAATEAQVQPLLPGAAECLVLVTSRRRLAALQATVVLSLDTLPDADAAELFVHAAGRLALTADAPGVRDAVGLCGRLPLAIRIAAARLQHRPVWTVTDLVTRLGDRGALDDGQHSVGAALDLSYRDLPVDAARLYRLLALHPGPDAEPYAAAALADCGVQEAQRLLDGLVDDHLLQETVAGRYRFHDLVRAHARSTTVREETQAQQQVALGRLLDYYGHATAMAMDAAYPYERQRRPAVAPAGTPTPDLSEQKRADLWLDTELVNLLAAAQHAGEHGRPEHTWQLAALLCRHLRVRGLFRDAHALYRYALNLARQHGDTQAEMDALNNLAHVVRLLGQHEQADDHYGSALRIAYDIGHRGARRQALTGLGAIHVMLARYDQAAESYGQALDIAREIGDRLGERTALTGQGNIDWMLSRYEQATDHYSQALHIAREIGDGVGERITLTGLARVHWMMGRFEAASDHYCQALQMAQATGHRVGEVYALTGLGNVHGMLGRHEQADALYQRALQLARDIGERIGELHALNGIGRVHRMLGRYNESAVCYQQMLDLAHGNGNWQFEALQGQGRLHHATGRPDLALAHHEQALRLADDLAQEPDRARAHDGIAHAYRAMGRPELARGHWQLALDILGTLGSDHTEDIEASIPNIHAHLAGLDLKTARGC